MGRLNLATGRIVLLLLFQRRQLGIAQDNAFGLYLGLQRLEPAPEVGQVVAQPNTAYPAAGDKNPSLPQFVTGALLTVCRKVDGMLADGSLRGLIHPVLMIGTLPAGLIEQGLDATLRNSCLVAVKGIAGQTHHLAGL